MFVFPQFLFQNRYLIFSNYHNLVFSGLWYLQMSKPDVATGRPIRPSGSGSRVRPRGSGHVGLDTWVWPLGPAAWIRPRGSGRWVRSRVLLGCLPTWAVRGPKSTLQSPYSTSSVASKFYKHQCFWPEIQFKFLRNQIFFLVSKHACF